MQARSFSITDRTRPSATRRVSLADFTLGEPCDVPGAELLDRSRAQGQLIPYCLDHTSGQVVFSETPWDVDLSAAPFAYQRQFETATRLYTVPYPLAERMARVAPAPSRLVFIFSVGRCGSTLVSKLWQAPTDTYSLSEPDVFTDLSRLLETGDLSQEQTARLFGAVLPLTHHPRRGGDRLVLKFRARCIDTAALCHRLFPAASLLFVYRNALDCVASQLRVFGAEPPIAHTLAQAFPRAPVDTERLGRLSQPLASWALAVNTYLALRESGVPVAALRYEDLVAAPEAHAALMFRHCATEPPAAERVRAVMSQDAQAGTSLARDPRAHAILSRDDEACLREQLAHGAGLSPDGILPGTLR